MKARDRDMSALKREILYRGKQKGSGEWVEGVPVQHSDGDWQIQGGYSDAGWQVTVIPETICEYTGLTDKNGRKIFEGDIIKDIDYGYMRCMYKYGTFIWYNEEGFGIKFMTYIPVIEVIGNIYDNPELLKGSL